MLTSSGQGRQLVNGFANRVQRQKDISVKRTDFRKPGLKTDVKKDMKQARDLKNRAAYPNTNSED